MELEELKVINAFFTYFFITEKLLSIIALGTDDYSKDKFNVFELLVAIFSVGERYLYGSSIISSFRIFRLFRLASTTSWDSVKIFIQTLFTSLVYLLNFMILLLVINFIFAVVNMGFFAGKLKFNENGMVDLINGFVPQSNFDSISQSMITTFQMIFCDKWDEVFY